MGQELVEAGRAARQQCTADPEGREGCWVAPKPKDSLTETPQGSGSPWVRALLGLPGTGLSLISLCAQSVAGRSLWEAWPGASVLMVPEPSSRGPWSVTPLVVGVFWEGGVLPHRPTAKVSQANVKIVLCSGNGVMILVIKVKKRREKERKNASLSLVLRKWRA